MSKVTEYRWNHSYIGGLKHVVHTDHMLSSSEIRMELGAASKAASAKHRQTIHVADWRLEGGVGAGITQ